MASLAEVLAGIPQAVGDWRDRGGLASVLGMQPADQQITDASEQQRPLIGQGKYLAAALAGMDNPALYAFGPGSIKAYHGSPHDFSAFDMSKIGTGEGAQAYGHGLYFAESEPVAWNYRMANAPAYLKNGADSFARQAAHVADQAGLSGDAARKYATDLLYKKAMDLDPSMRQPWFDAMNNYDQLAGGHATPGRMYEVNINAEPHQLLDWDSPASAQPAPVINALNQIWQQRGGSLEGRQYPPFAAHGEARGDSLHAALATSLGDSQQAAQALLERGVPGIRYLDQGSRGAGEGSHNYVMFDDKLIDIVRKYGLAGLLAGGATASGEE